MTSSKTLRYKKLHLVFWNGNLCGQAITKWFWLLLIFIYFEETTIQRNMAVICIRRWLFTKYKRYGRIYFEMWHFGCCPVCNIFEQQWIASYIRLLYWLSLIIFKFIWQHHVPVNEIYWTKVKKLHLNCLPSIYKIMQTKNANESVS